MGTRNDWKQWNKGKRPWMSKLDYEPMPYYPNRMLTASERQARRNRRHPQAVRPNPPAPKNFGASTQPTLLPGGFTKGERVRVVGQYELWTGRVGTVKLIDAGMVHVLIDDSGNIPRRFKPSDLVRI